MSDGEVVKLLAPGQVRRVRAIACAVQTPEGSTEGPQGWIDLKRETPGDRARR